MIPPIGAQGYLPPGIHDASWREIEKAFGFTPQRKKLLIGLKAGLEALKRAGCRKVFIDGSFVTGKPAPGDYDCCWDLAGVDAAKLDQVFLRFENKRLAQKTKYFGEFFPMQMAATKSGQTYLEFFQVDKDSGDKKGIVVIDLIQFAP